MLFWLIIGLVFIFSEIVIPGGIVVFLGFAALVVALGIHFEFINNWVHAATVWFVMSLTLIIFLRGITQKLVGGDTSIDNIDEDVDAIGQEAEVIEEITNSNIGRIRFRGTTWSAKKQDTSKVLSVGEKVVVTGRDNTIWLVAQIEQD